MENRRVFEFFVMVLIIGIGAPSCILWGYLDGEKMAQEAYPKTKIEMPKIEIDYKTMILSSPENIEKGKEIFSQNCVACHGSEADGKGAAATTLNPPPRNFQDPLAKWTNGREAINVFHTISKGSPGTAMVGFGNTLTPAERWALTHFILSQPGQKGKFKTIDESMIESLKKEN